MFSDAQQTLLHIKYPKVAGGFRRRNPITEGPKDPSCAVSPLQPLSTNPGAERTLLTKPFPKWECMMIRPIKGKYYCEAWDPEP